MQGCHRAISKTFGALHSVVARRSCATSGPQLQGSARFFQWAGLASGSLAVGCLVARQQPSSKPSECHPTPFLGGAGKQESLPRVAICFSGELRSFKDPDKDEPTTYHQIKKLVEALPPADVFCSVFQFKQEKREQDMATVKKLLSPKRLEHRHDMEDEDQMLELGKHEDIDVLQACYPKSDEMEKGKQARTNGYVFWGIRHAHRLMMQEENSRGLKYDIVVRVRYDLTFEKFMWTKAGAQKYFAYGMKSAPPEGSLVTPEQLTIFQNIDHEYLKVHKMVEYGHLTVEDTVAEVTERVQAALKEIDQHSTQGAEVKEIVRTPAIHTWGGCNDQFGFGTRKAMESYAGTWDRYHSLIEKARENVSPGFFEALQTEKCLEKTLRNDNIGIIRAHKVVARILRENGDVSTQ